MSNLCRQPFLCKSLLFDGIEFGTLLGQPGFAELGDFFLDCGLHGLTPAREDVGPDQGVKSVQQLFINGDGDFGDAHI